MEDEDEVDFLRFVRSTAEIQLLESCAPSPEGLRVDALQPRELGHWQYFIWNTAYPWAPQLSQVVSTAPHRAGWYFHKNISTAPVIEYDRHNFAPRGVEGRLYWSKDFSAVGPLEYDAAAFSKWYEQIIRVVSA